MNLHFWIKKARVAVWKIYARFLIMEDPSSHSLPSKCSDYLNVWLDWINGSLILGKHQSLLSDVQVKVLEVIGHFLSAILLQQTAFVYFSSFEKTDLLTRSSLLLLFFLILHNILLKTYLYLVIKACMFDVWLYESLSFFVVSGVWWCLLVCIFVTYACKSKRSC